MSLTKFRSMSVAELAKDLARPFRFEVWREEPNVKDRPYRRKTDQRTRSVWHNLGNSTDWRDVLALVKPRQRLKITTYISSGRFGSPGQRRVSIHIVNRKPAAKAKGKR